MKRLRHTLGCGLLAVAALGAGTRSVLADGSVVAWGYNYNGQCNVPPPNTGFTAVTAERAVAGPVGCATNGRGGGRLIPPPTLRTIRSIPPCLKKRNAQTAKKCT